MSKMEFLISDTLLLRALEPEDLPLLYKWENNTQWWDGGNTLVPYSKYILREYLINSDKPIFETKQLRLMITLKDSNQTIGMIDLYDFEGHHGRAGVGIMIDNPFQQKGYAAQALRLLVDYAFQFLQINQLYAYITVDNFASIRLFTSVGFTSSGVLKQWIKSPQGYKDVSVYQLVNNAHGGK